LADVRFLNLEVIYTDMEEQYCLSGSSGVIEHQKHEYTASPLSLQRDSNDKPTITCLSTLDPMRSFKPSFEKTNAGSYCVRPKTGGGASSAQYELFLRLYDVSLFDKKTVEVVSSIG
jgi:hypothetical protein